MEDLEVGEKEYELVGELFAEIKKKFREGNKKSLKVVDLKEIEQGSRIIEEYVQDFRRAVRGSSYVGHPLIEEFK